MHSTMLGCCRSGSSGSSSLRRRLVRYFEAGSINLIAQKSFCATILTTKTTATIGTTSSVFSSWNTGGAVKFSTSKRTSSYHDKKKRQQQTSPSKEPGAIIAARPPGETDNFESKFPLPDKDKELELSHLQNDVLEHHSQGHFKKALQASERLVERTRAHFGGDNHPAVASALSNVGLMHKLLGQFDPARKNYQKALKIYKATVGADHSSTASILHNLGTLNRTQLHLDEDLKGTDRLTLLEESLECLEQAYKIRLEERGPHHPQTVASRSGWGASCAANILYHYKQTAPKDGEAGAAVSKPSYVLVSESLVTKEAWDAAEDHLRQALQTALENPRGRKIEGDKSTKRPQQQKFKGKSSSSMEPTASLTPSGAFPLSVAPMQTLSAAAAGQNLAIFLKARATTQTPYNMEWLQEADQLYKDVLKVRLELLPGDHPDVYATKHSHAELLQAMGDEDAANAIRQDIIDSIDNEQKPPAPADRQAIDDSFQPTLTKPLQSPNK